MNWFKSIFNFIGRSIGNFILDIYNSFKDTREGFGSKRLTTFAFMLLVAYLHKTKTPENEVSFLVVDCIMILLLLAILTTEKLIEILAIFKNQKDEKTNNTPTDNNSI